jgi:hypothetical protein
MNINKYDVISFDIFDTLLSRRLAKPQDVFSLMESYLSSISEWVKYPDLIDNFTMLRVRAEAQARKNKVEMCGGEPEILIHHIYDEIRKVIGFTLVEQKELINIELMIEKSILFKPKKVSKLFHDAVNSGAMVVIISDMYLTSDMLKDLLNNCGYNINEKIRVFSSGDEGVSKHSGKLYELVREKLNIDSNVKWLHIGDNSHADISSAKIHGIKAHLADWSANNYTPIPHWLAKDIVGKSICNFTQLPQAKEFYNSSSVLESIGFKYFGPLLLGYISWFVQLAKDKNIEKLIFLARDAHLIQKLYKKYFSKVYPFEQDYMYVSRATAYKLGITDWPMHRIWSFFSGKNKKSIAKILALFNLKEYEYISELKEIGFTDSSYIPSESEFQKIHWLVNRLYVKILRSSSTYREEYISYFKNMTSGITNIAFIDVGWAGNIQTVLARALSNDWINKEISGFYLATFDNAVLNKSMYNIMEGWLVNDGKPEHIMKTLLSGGVELLELAMADNTGSTKDYQKDSHGNIIPIRESITESEKIYLSSAKQIQDGIYQFFDYISPLVSYLPVSCFTSIFLADNFMNLILSPTKDEISALADITHSEAAGDNNSRLSLAKKIHLKDRLFRTNKYYEELNQSYWKQSFLIRNRRAFWK